MSPSIPRFALFGRPVAHSLSPRIHAAFGAQLGLALDYRAIDSGRDDFAAALDAFVRAGGRGANVTLPLKEDAARLCAQLSDRARRCASVNTLLRVGEDWQGDSTDGAGLLRDLRERHGFNSRDRHILLLGAGGAARAVAFALVDAGAASLAIANRTRTRAQALADAIDVPGRVRVVDAQHALASFDIDLVINATSAGHGVSSTVAWPAPAKPLAPHVLCYDLSYARAADAFLAWARAAGARRVTDGLGMLVEQAAESFMLWHGVRPPTAPTLAALRAHPD